MLIYGTSASRRERKIGVARQFVLLFTRADSDEKNIIIYQNIRCDLRVV